MVIVIMMTMIGALEELWHYIVYKGRIKLTKIMRNVNHNSDSDQCKLIGSGRIVILNND